MRVCPPVCPLVCLPFTLTVCSQTAIIQLKDHCFFDFGTLVNFSPSTQKAAESTTPDLCATKLAVIFSLNSGFCIYNKVAVVAMNATFNVNSFGYSRFVAMPHHTMYLHFGQINITAWVTTRNVFEFHRCHRVRILEMSNDFLF